MSNPIQRDRLHGALPWAAATVWLVAAGAWLGWPLWWSLTAPSRDAQQEATGWVLGALLSLLLMLAWALWRQANRRLETLSPLALLTVAAVFLRVAVNPSGAGIEFALLAPLLAGIAYGGPAGVLTGALSAAASAVVTDTIASQLPGQLFVWALWGLVGGLLRRLPVPAAWLAGIVCCLPLGVLSGLLLNLTGWATEEGVTTGAFIPGLGPVAELRAAWAYTVDTSLVWDITRSLSTALALGVLGLPLLRALRSVAAPRPKPQGLTPTERPISPNALRRRETAAEFDQLWADE